MMKWAKEHGFRYYDFEGIDATVARAKVDGCDVPDGANDGVTSFKLGFGGDIRILPEAHDYVFNPLARWAYRTGFPRVADTAAGARAMRQLRSG
jgi:lipid II:glycine glycyltransferase (peptidoglycan interpeptide bridge formation enzyme)